MAVPHPSDAELMQALKAGRAAAFETLYARHHRAVFHFLLRALGDRPAAEDLLQEAFLRVYIHRTDYRPTAAFRTWLFTIARNLLIDHVRQRHARPALAREDPPATVPDPGASPLQHAQAQDLAARLQAAILRLPPAQREVLLLSRFAGLAHTDVAQVTGASPGAVRVTLHRALRALRNLLGPG